MHVSGQATLRWNRKWLIKCYGSLDGGQLLGLWYIVSVTWVILRMVQP